MKKPPRPTAVPDGARAEVATRAIDLERRLRDKEDLLARERRMRDELERSNEVKDRLIAILAHDLRPPTNAILGWVQLLQREILDSSARNRALATVERNVVLQAKLMDELLDISRLGIEKPHLELVPVSLAAVVDGAIDDMLPATLAAGIDLVFVNRRDEPDIGRFQVLGDRRRLEQILSRLLANARRFTPAGGRIEVALVQGDGEVHLEVRDNGKGMAKNVLSHLFELSSRDPEYPAGGHGGGVGLYIVRRLVQLQHGSVGARSDGPGHGTTFVVVLPCGS